MGNSKDKVAVEEKEYYSLVERAFNLLAPFYDVVTFPIQNMRGKVADFTGAKSGSRILDVATGTGKQAFAFAKKGYEVIAVDLSEAMLWVANKKNRYARLKFQVADATNLPFEDKSFDVSCVSFALHDMPLSIREKVVREMVRVTRPAGMVVVVDYALPENRIGRALIYKLIKIYESKYYIDFIHSDLEELLSKSGVEIRDRLSILLGAGRIIKGVRCPRFEEYGIADDVKYRFLRFAQSDS